MTWIFSYSSHLKVLSTKAKLPTDKLNGNEYFALRYP